VHLLKTINQTNEMILNYSYTTKLPDIKMQSIMIVVGGAYMLQLSRGRI
jgi:hypothetical protein